ncbi:DUF3102 domain-containing protein [Bradyrhizobium sp. USDA 4508]
MSNRLPVLADEIKAALKGLTATATTAFEYAVSVGDKLVEAKALLHHGEWLPWLNDHCSLSERQAQKYMRIARAKEALAAKAPLTADLTIERAIEVLAVAKPISLLPPAGFMRLGEYKSCNVVIAPSYQHPGFFYVTRYIWAKHTGEIVGGRRPMRSDYVEPMIVAMLGNNISRYGWRDVSSPSWAYNILLFNAVSDYVNSLCVLEPEDEAELVYLTKRAEPIDFGIFVRRQVRQVEVVAEAQQ